MRPRAILKIHSNSCPFEERTLDLTSAIKVGRAAKHKPGSDNATFDCKVLSRNHATIWFEKGKFFVQDSGSSNGTFINNNRLSPANEDSLPKEIHSNDIIQFGVEVVDSTSKITHSCIILKIKLFYPDGSEAYRTRTMFHIPTANMLPSYYSYTQMVEREQQIYQKLGSIEEVLEEAHLLADMTLNAKKEEEQLAKKLDELQMICDEKTKYAQSLKSEMETLRDLKDKLDLRHEEESKLIMSLELRVNEKEIEVKHLNHRLNRMISHNHGLVATILVLLSIVIVVGGYDMVVLFARLILR